MTAKLRSLLTFALGVAFVGVGSVCIVFLPPLGLFILPFGVVFLLIGGLTLLFHARGVKLREHHVIENAVGLFFFFFWMILVFSNSRFTWMALVTGMVFLALGCFPWANKLPSYVTLPVGGTLLAVALLARVYVPLVVPISFEGNEGTPFLKHLITYTLGVPGIALIFAGVAALFRRVLFNCTAPLRLKNSTV